MLECTATDNGAIVNINSYTGCDCSDTDSGRLVIEEVTRDNN